MKHRPYRITRFTRRMREEQTNWSSPRKCKWAIVHHSRNGKDYIVSIVPPHQKRRFGKIAARLNGKAVKL